MRNRIGLSPSGGRGRSALRTRVFGVPAAGAPEFEFVILAAAEDLPAVRREGDTADGETIRNQRQQELAAGGVPDLERVVVSDELTESLDAIRRVGVRSRGDRR